MNYSIAVVRVSMSSVSLHFTVVRWSVIVLVAFLGHIHLFSSSFHLYLNGSIIFQLVKDVDYI